MADRWKAGNGVIAPGPDFGPIGPKPELPLRDGAWLLVARNVERGTGQEDREPRKSFRVIDRKPA
jgi:hypothetical protein